MQDPRATELARARLADIVERERAARLARDDFFAAVTHDLRNPLTVIRGQSQRLLRRHGQDADTAPLVAILTQTDRLNRMVTSLLDVARFQSGSAVTLQFREIRIDETVSLISRAVLGPEQEERLHLDVTPVTATVDPARLEQVVANLVENAAKYSPAGMPIEVQLTADVADALLMVADHGPGIPSEDRGRVFDRYTRVGPMRDAAHGLGLGLFVVQIAVAAHGGTVVVGERSDGAPGAAISVRLPLRPAGGAVPQRDGAGAQV